MQRLGSGREREVPSNALGSQPMNANNASMNDPLLAALKGMRQYYLYVAVASTSGSGGMMASPNASVMAVHAASEMKLDLITDLLEDIDFGQCVIYCAHAGTLEAIVYKLASKSIDAVGLTRDMNAYTRSQTLSRFRSPTHNQRRRALVVSDVAVNPKEVHQVPLIVFYDMPRSVDEYKDKIACAASGSIARPSVCVNVVTASGGPRGDVEMLRTLECHLACKMAELPMDPKQILHF